MLIWLKVGLCLMFSIGVYVCVNVCACKIYIDIMGLVFHLHFESLSLAVFHLKSRVIILGPCGCGGKVW